MTTVIEALKKTVKVLEQTPEKYNFFTFHSPRLQGGTACILGWAGHFLGIAEEHSYSYLDRVAERVMPPNTNVPQLAFYRVLENLAANRETWHLSAEKTLPPLRAYIASLEAA